MTVLSVNLNKVALIRNFRDTTSLSPVEFAAVAIAAGAGGITVHPRPDQRHIRVSDCHAFAQSVDVEFNIEGNPFADPMASDRAGVSDYPGFMALLKRHVQRRRLSYLMATPNSHQIMASTCAKIAIDWHPLSLSSKTGAAALVYSWIRSLKICGLAAAIGADRVELYTESYAVAFAVGDYALASIGSLRPLQLHMLQAWA